MALGGVAGPHDLLGSHPVDVGALVWRTSMKVRASVMALRLAGWEVINYLRHHAWRLVKLPVANRTL
jgi:hypothetical protein